MNTQRESEWRATHQKPFDLDQHEDLLIDVIGEIKAVERLTNRELGRILRKHPLPNGDLLSKNQLLKGYRRYCEREGHACDRRVIRRLRVKPTRTISGVAPVTVLTKPAPCPGECIFCPEISQMPKSYLPNEPGAMRAASYEFDPYKQTAGRIETLIRNGHNVDKVELLILGGTWSCYEDDYQEWFIHRCFDAMNEEESDTLEKAQRRNEEADHRNVGLVIETRPDLITVDEIHRLRWLGVTKVQIGVQSLDDEILRLNRRGHTVADTHRAMRLLRLGGFKVVVHWMPNLFGATPESDLEDFRRLWDDPAMRPDELKIYPTALLPDTELYRRWKRGEYEPYDEETMIDLLKKAKQLIEPYCRVNRLMRDIPSTNIVAGVKKTNLRQIVQQHMEREGLKCRCIRCREVRGQPIDPDTVSLQRLSYDTDGTREIFLHYVTPSDKIAGFLRLSLPQVDPVVDELEGCAMIREIHVYGPALALGAQRKGMAQHSGLGTTLIEQAVGLARDAGYDRLAVIAAIGTRPYYEERGFTEGDLYRIRPL